MNEIDILGWLNERPLWFRCAFKMLIDNKSLENEDYNELLKLCKEEATGNKLKIEPPLFQNLFSTDLEHKVKLLNISGITGINALAPKVPLNFGNNNLAIVYGQNGTGKSGYVRILKHICGTKNPGNLHSNVFSQKTIEQKCSIVYTKNNESISCDWKASMGKIHDLQGTDIFDNSCSKVYISSENEVTYEPRILSLFSDIISVCDKITNMINEEISAMTSNKPALPLHYAMTKAGQWYKNISVKTKDNDVILNCSWSESDEQKISEMQKRISEKAPAEIAKTIRQQQQYIKDLIKLTKTHIEELSPENCKKIFSLREDLMKKKEIAKAAADKVFNNSSLEGIGNDVWKKLWEHAQKYSEEVAYKNLKFPNIGQEALCVLCHQPLSDIAKSRMISFEEFVKGAAQEDLKNAEKILSDELSKISEISTIENLKIKSDAAGLSSGDELFSLNDEYEIFRKQKDLLLTALDMNSFISIPNCQEWIDNVEKRIIKSEEIAMKYELDSKTDNRLELSNELLELQAKKWLSEQSIAINEEIKLLRNVNLLNSAKKLASTKSISIKKGELAETLITEAFVKRFNEELNNLNAHCISVELVKTRVDKGKVLHKLKLKEAISNIPEEVLSEGEHRIVALSAFLADATGKNISTPFVFDDPISSLDQAFEETVVQRLISLSKERQVIVFTHRLSLLSFLQDYAKKEKIEPEIICVRKELWGTGEPGDTPLFAKKTDKALNSLINDRLPKAQKLLSEQGQEIYEPYSKSLCSDFRILIERMIEIDLLSDVVQRYRRSINTLGKIERLSKISAKDCQYFDELMTKYSRFEHSQSNEAPVVAPLPEELKKDFEELKLWQAEFSRR